MTTGLNRCTLIGNLGQDPLVRYTQSGSAVCNLRLAVSERRKVGEEWKDHTEWFDVVVFGKSGENAGQYLAKGRQVAVDGRLQTRSYKDKDGNEKWKTEVIANEVIFLGGNPDKGASSAPAVKPDPKPSPQDSTSLADAEMPF